MLKRVQNRKCSKSNKKYKNKLLKWEKKVLFITIGGAKTLNANHKKRIKTQRQKGLGTVDWLLILIGLYFAGSWLAGKAFDAGRVTLDESQARGKAAEVEQYARLATLAGIDFVADDGVIPALTRLAEGRTASSGAYEGQLFAMPELKGENLLAVGALMKIEHGALLYCP